MWWKKRLAAGAVATYTAAGAMSVGCEAEKAAPAPAPVEAKLVVKGKLALTVDSSPVEIDYNGLPVSISVAHKTNPDPKGYGCVTKLNLAIEKADGSCRLELNYLPSASGLRIAAGRFFAAKAITADGVTLKTVPCIGWPGAATATKEVSFEVLAGEAGISFGPLGPGKANLAKARLDNQKLTFTGALTWKKLATKVTVALQSLTLEGSVESIGDPNAACGGAVGKTGTSECSKQGKPGETVGDIFRRDGNLFACDTETVLDLGELCGSDVIWIIDWRDWTKSTLLTMVAQVRDAYKKNTIGIAVVVTEGMAKVPVCDPPEGKTNCKPTGPAPTAADCLAIAARDNVPKDALLLFDKNRELHFTGKKLTASTYVPAMLFAKPDGTIVKILPDAAGTTPALADLTQAVQEVLDAP